jgi:hypothetical protein
MNTRHLLFATLIAALLLSACAAPLASRTEGGAPSYAYTEQEAYGGAVPPAAEPAADGVKTVGQATTAERLVIRNASLTMVVANPAEASEHIGRLADSLGGFIVSSYVYQASVDAEGRSIMRANITVRVPSGQLDAALAQIREMAVEVRTENISGQDVTAEYTDLESQLRNLEAAEAQLVRIMDGATKTEDVLAVFNQLTYIRQQIEQVRGQMKYYRESAAMSAISAELLPDALNRPIEVGGWRAQGVVRDALEALLRTARDLATAGIWLGVYCLPLALVIGVPAVLAVRYAARRIRRSRAAA